MPLLNLKSDLSNYKGNLNVEKSTEQITKGNTKLVTPNKNYPGLDITKINSVLSPNSNINKNNNSNIKVPEKYDLAVNKNWLKQKEVFKYNSIFSIDTPEKLGTTKQTRLKTIVLNSLKKENSVLFLNSKQDTKLLKEFSNIKEKVSNVEIKKIEYDINDYKSDVKLEDIKRTTVLNNSVLNRDYNYNVNAINYESQSKIKQINKYVKSSNLNSIFEVNEEYVKTNKDILSNKFNNINFKINEFGFIDLGNSKLYNSRFDDIKNETNLYTDKSIQTPKLNIKFENTNEEYKLPEISKTKLKLINLEKMDSLFNDIIEFGLKDISNKKIYNSKYDIDKLIGVNYLDDKFSKNFIVRTSNESNFSRKFISQYTFDNIQSVNDFIINVEHFNTYYNANDSRFSYKNNLVNMISDYNAIGFVYKQKDTLYNINSTELRWKDNKIKAINYIDVSNEFANQFELRQLNSNYNIDSTNLRWKSDKIPNVNYLDIKNINQQGFNLKTELLKTYYNQNSSNLVWIDKIPNVNYLDIKNINQQGFNLKTELLKTYYNTNSTNLRWIGNIPNVNYLDIKNINQSGFNLKTELLKTYYTKDISEYDFDGSKFNAPEVNYFDVNRSNTILGFRKLIRHHESDYVKDSSLLDYDGESTNAPTVNFFDKSKRNSKLGFKKLVKLNESDYVKDSSIFDWDGSSKVGPNVNYLDVSNKFHKGFNKFPLSKVTNYNNDISEFVWKGDNILNINHLDVDKKNTKKGFIIRTLRLSDYKFNTTDLRWKTKEPLSMDFFNNTNSKNFQLRQRLHQVMFNTQTSNLVWKGDKVPTTNFIDPSYKNQLGFTKSVKLGETEYKLQSSELGIKGSNFVDYIRNNDIEGFTLKFINVSDSKFKVGLSYFDNIENSKYNTTSKYSSNVVDIYSNFNKETKYLNVFRNDKNNFVSNFNKEGSTSGVNNIEDFNSNGFITKQNNVRFTNFKLNGNELSNFFLSPLPTDIDRYSNKQEFNLRPKFKSEFRTLYTKLGNPRDIAYNPDLIWHQPFVLRGLMDKDVLGPEVYGWVNSSFDDGFIRGGLLTYTNRVVDDLQRMGKFYTSGKGLLFMARQLLLQKTNPNVEIYPKPSTGNPVADGFFGAISNFLFGRPTQTFNPVTQVLSAKGFYGPLLRRHSLDLFSGDDIVLGKYGAIVNKRNENSKDRTQLENIPTPTILDREGIDNRLLQLTKELFPDWMKSGFQEDNMNYFANVRIGKNIERLSGGSGPGSFFAVGSTNFKRYEITNRTYDTYDVNASSFSSGKVPKLRSLHKHTSDKQYASFENYNNSSLATRTRSTDTLSYSRTFLFDANIDEVVSITNLITDLETYDKNTRIYNVNKSYHTINNPFRTINGVLGNTFKREDDYQYISQRAKELKENRSNYVKTGSLADLVSDPSFVPAALYSDYNSSINNTNEGIDNSSFGEYVTMAYEDIQLVSNTMKKDRMKYMGIVSEGGYSLLNTVEPNAIEDRYKQRVNLIGRILKDGKVSKTNDSYTSVKSIGSQGSSIKPNGGSRVNRSDPYWFKFPGDGKPRLNWRDTLKDSRGDKLNLIDVIYKAKSGVIGYDKLFKDANGNKIQDFVPLIFASATYNQMSVKDAEASILIFRATMTSVSDSHNASWESNNVMGRGDKVYMYNGYDRSVSFDFKIVATSLEEQFTNWRKINELASFTAPDFGKDRKSRMMGHVMRLTLGDLYVGVPVLLDNVNYTFNFESGVELGGIDSKGQNTAVSKNVLVLPSIIDVSVSFTVIGNYRPEKGGRLYELTNIYGRTWHPLGLAAGKSTSEQDLDNMSENDSNPPTTPPVTETPVVETPSATPVNPTPVEYGPEPAPIVQEGTTT